MQHRHLAIPLLDRVNLWGVLCALVCTGLMVSGCVSNVKPDATTLAALQIDADVNDPTAEVLHDLAGKLLMYAAIHHKLPASLDQLKDETVGGGGTQTTSGANKADVLDPGSNLPFVYVPDSAIQAKLPGRIVVYQPREQGPAGRWALLLNDLGNQGRIITYVQRVPEALLPKIKDKHPTFRQTLP